MSLSWKEMELSPLSIFLPKALCFVLLDSPWGEMPSQIIPSCRDTEDIQTLGQCSIVRRGWVRGCLLFKKCEKGFVNGWWERKTRGVFSGWWVLEKSAVDVKDLNSNDVKAIRFCISPGKSSSDLRPPKGCILQCEDRCSWSSTQDWVHSEPSSEKSLLYHLPLLLQPCRARGVTSSLIHSFNKHLLCESHRAFHAPLASWPRHHLEWPLSTKYGDSDEPWFVITLFHNNRGVWREQLVTWFEKSAYSISRHLSPLDSRS